MATPNLGEMIQIWRRYFSNEVGSTTNQMKFVPENTIPQGANTDVLAHHLWKLQVPWTPALWAPYCWWFVRNPVSSPVEVGSRLSIVFLYIFGGCLGFLNHQQKGIIWTHNQSESKFNFFAYMYPKNFWDVMGCQNQLFWGPRGVIRRVWCFHRCQDS